MRKSTKLLTVVLTLALLCTTFAVAAFAALVSVDATGNLTINSDDRIVQFSAQDFSGEATAEAPTGSAGYNNDIDPKPNTSFLTTTNGNQHFWYQRPAAAQHAWAGVLSGPMDGSKDPQSWRMIDYDYVVVDFEIASNAYVDYDETYLANGKAAWKLTDTPDADSRLAYRPITGTSMVRFWVGSTHKTNSKQIFKIYANGNQWFISGMNGENATALPNAVNEWTHISIIYEIDNSLTYDGETVVGTGLENTKAHVYVNGSYLTTAGNVVEIDSYFTEGNSNYVGQLNDYIDKIGFQQIRLQGSSYESDVSMCLDNLTSYYYKKGYDGDLATFVKNNVTNPICTNSDVVYSGDYVSPNGPLATVDGTVYSIEAAMLDAIKEGSEVSLSGNVGAQIYPKCSFTLVANGYNFDVAVDSGYIKAPTDVDGTYTVRPITDADKATIIFGEKGSDVYAEVAVATGALASHPTLKVGTPIDGGLFLGWTNEKGSSTPVETVAGAMGSTTTYYPIYENVSYAYVMTNGSEVLVKGTEAKNFATDYVTAAAKTKTLYIILGADLYTSEYGSSLSPAGMTLTLDLNGYDIYHCYINKANAAPGNPAFFTPGANTTINVYSSRPGADFISLSHQVNVNGYTGANNSGIIYITSSTRGNCSFNFGNGTDNLTVHTSILLNNNNAANQTLTLNGGKFYCPRNNSVGFIISRYAGAVVNVNVKNADIAINAQHTLFGARDNGIITGKVENSNVYAYALLANWIAGCSLTFENTDLSGSIGVTSGDGEIILGEGCRYTYDSLPSFFKADDGLVLFDWAAKEDVSFSVYWPVSTDNETFTEASLTTPKKVPITAQYVAKVIKESDIPKEVTVTWYDSFGIELYSDTYYEGQTAVYDESKGQYGFERIDNWFITGIAGWSKEAGSNVETSLVVSNSNKNFYVIEGKTPSLQAYQNYQTTSGVKRYAYIQVPADGSGIEILTIYDENRRSECYDVANSSRYFIVEINGVQYYQIWDAPGVITTSVQKYTVTYTYNGNEYTETKNFDNAITYFEKLLVDEKVEQEAKVLAANMLKYMQTIWAYSNALKATDANAANETINRLVTTYEELLITDLDEIIVKDYVYDVAALTSIEGVTFAVGDGNGPTFAIILKEGATAPTATIPSLHTGINEINFSRPATIYHFESEPNYDKLYFADLFGVWDARQPITIQDGENVGTFSLAAYILYLEGIETPTELETKAIDVCKALYAYSIASYNYKTRNAGK